MRFLEVTIETPSRILTTTLLTSSRPAWLSTEVTQATSEHQMREDNCETEPNRNVNWEWKIPAMGLL